MQKAFLSKTVYFVLLFFPFIGNAQAIYEDVVYLKNGSEIHGTIIEQVPNKSLKIMTRDESVFAYKLEEIEKITKEEIEIKGRLDYNKVKKQGYINITELNAGIGSGGITGIETINGYQFKPMISVGLGTGIDVDESDRLTLIPVFVDVRAYMLNKPVSPYMSAQAGYSFSADGANNGGRLVHFAFGVRTYVSVKSALLFSVGYRLQNINYKTTSVYSPYYYENNQNYGYVDFKVGFMF